ncbi:unnamed protein product, partial [Coregonus sp. 'balchen']
MEARMFSQGGRAVDNTGYSQFIEELKLLCCGQTDAESTMILLTPSSGFFQRTNKLFLSEQATGVQLKEFVRKNAANALSMANMLMGMASILCSLNGHQHAACWLVLIGYLLDLADGAVARQLDACSALGAKLDDFADFTTFGIATSLLLRTHALMDNILCMCYVLSVFVRLCFFSSGIPFMYRGLPCIYSSAILACLSLLTGGNMVILRVTAVAMILFMVNQGFYPHDRELSWCSVPLSLRHVCTTCCGLSPTFCSQHLFGVAKCRSRPAGLTKAPRLLLLAIHSGSKKDVRGRFNVFVRLNCLFVDHLMDN